MQGRIRIPPSMAIGLLIALLAFLVLSYQACKDLRTFGERSRQAEAKANLKKVFALQEDYKKSHGRYAQTFKDLGFTPVGERRYTYILGDDVLRADIPGAYSFKGPADLSAIISRAAPDPATGFLCIAVANLDADTTLDLWTIDEQRQIRNVVNDLGE